MKILKAFNIQIWCGLKETYDDENIHIIDDVRNIVDIYVNSIMDCVTITPTEFRYVGGSEPGVIVGWIQYPRFPREEKEIEMRSINLAKSLMYGLNQCRITITTPKHSIMLENKEVKG